MTERFERVVAILKPYVRGEAQITTESDILGDLKVNSARVIDIVLAVEDEFEIKIEESEEEAIVTVGDIVELVGSKTQVA